MSVPPVESAFEPLVRRTFAFYPPIANVEHNEWRFSRTAWSEVLVVNAKTGLEVWIPRRYLGEISRVEDPLVIVGLAKELEFKAGTVWPRERRVIEMPRVNESPAPAQPASAKPALLAGRRREPSAESRIGRLIAAVLLIGIVAVFVVVSIFRQGPLRPVKFTATDQEFLSLNRRDDYHSVVRMLGPPEEQRWRSEAGELQYSALWYPQRSYYVILMGTDRNSARYVGTLDRNWRLVHYVELANGGDTASLLRGLRKF